MRKSGNYKLITNYPVLVEELDRGVVEELFAAYCAGIQTGEYTFSDKFLGFPDDLQKDHLKTLSHFIKDNLLIDKIFQCRLHSGVLRLDTNGRSAIVELTYNSLN